jgi:anti-sigma B factor antagonist
LTAVAVQSSAERFYLEVRAAEDHVDVAVSGPLDVSTVVDLQQLAVALPGTSGPVVLDLAGLTFLDSSGISALAGFKGELDVQLRQLSVVNVSPRILDLLRMVGMDEALGVSG